MSNSHARILVLLASMFIAILFGMAFVKETFEKRAIQSKYDELLEKYTECQRVVGGACHDAQNISCKTIQTSLQTSREENEKCRTEVRNLNATNQDTLELYSVCKANLSAKTDSWQQDGSKLEAELSDYSTRLAEEQVRVRELDREKAELASENARLSGILVERERATNKLENLFERCKSGLSWRQRRKLGL